MCDMSCLVLRGPLTMGDDIALPADYMYYTPSQSSLLPDLLSTLGTLLYLLYLPGFVPFSRSFPPNMSQCLW